MSPRKKRKGRRREPVSKEGDHAPSPSWRLDSSPQTFTPHWRTRGNKLSVEDLLAELRQELPEMSSEKIEDLIAEGERELANLRQVFPESDEVSYPEPQSPEELQIRFLQEYLPLLRLEAGRRGLTVAKLETEHQTEGRIPRARRPLRPRDLEAHKRREAIAGIVAVSAGRPKTKQICGKLDTLNVLTPEEWSDEEGGRLGWVKAYESQDLRPRVVKMISDDISENSAKTR